MEAPDKIYLERSLSFPDKIHRQWYKEDVVGNGVEYIRKDLLLEWAKEEQAKCSSETHPYAMFMNVVIEKLESL